MTDTGMIISGPAATIAVPPRGEEMFPVRFKEWARLKEKIAALKRHRRQWSGLGWALVGIGASGLLSWLPYYFSDAAGTAVAIVTIVVGVAGLVGGALALLFGKETQKSIDVAVHEVRVYMYDMESGLTDEQRGQITAMMTVVLDT